MECVCASRGSSNERKMNSTQHNEWALLLNEESHNSRQPTIGRSHRPFVHCTNARIQLTVCTNSPFILITLPCVYLYQLTHTIKVFSLRCYTLFHSFRILFRIFVCCVLCVLMFFFLLHDDKHMQRSQRCDLSYW